MWLDFDKLVAIGSVAIALTAFLWFRSARDNGIDLIQVRIDSQAASVAAVREGAYPYWQTEYAYTYGDPRATPIAASFLRFLNSQIGQDILRTNGSSSCAQTENPLICEPT
ncbi:hypothetical protein I2W78_21785 [Streptomyces spinoverrucosus]|uniref:hypothetical protein n=1 Tax=Streptomyces spinoverrucosus TaxID=284043 RepID=UPI0018C44040|nr:hypothetical protein [Streptomyces spinoverrucosus]MBG0854395.1 hypothetical protein [Streptomyces spinoverrucosus]